MSWTQNSYIPLAEDLLVQLTGVTAQQALAMVAQKKGIVIVDTREIVIGDDGYMGDLKALEYKLKDGRVFSPTLVKRECWDGNTGYDTYAFHEHGTPKPIIGDWNDGVKIKKSKGRKK